MAQKTNLNVSPYFDDFDPSKNHYKVLFSPGRPVQARELNNLQSQIQNQIEKFGSHIFKDGSMVIPGGVTYDFKYYAVKLNPIQFGININIYIKNFLGKKVIGRISGISAIVDYIVLPNEDENVEYITLYVKYIDSGNDNIISQFPDSESLYVQEDVVYGNTTIPLGTVFATTISENSTSTGSAAHVNTGIYFIRGYFVEVQKQTLILDYYTNKPSYKIGFTVNETIITPKEDNSLYDNAKGFTNYAAPGADRFSITLKLDKRPLNELSDSNFVELIRTDDGEIKKEDTTTQYSIIRDYLAKRTYEESGDYSVNPFQIKVRESLNDRIGNNGVYFKGETTDEGNQPSSDLGTLVISPGVAYVGGYDVDKTTSTLVDFVKPRTTETRDNVFVLFKMGNYLRVNNVDGAPLLKGTVGLYNRRKNSSSSANGIKIGDARVYNFSLTDSKYIGPSTSWDLYLYDIQTYTEITLNESVSSSQVPQTAYIKGKSSSASGYSVFPLSSSTNVLYLRETSGTFTEGEKISINGNESVSRTIKNIKVFSINDIKSIFRGSSDGVGNFSADTILESSTLPGFSSLDEFFLTTGGNITSPGKFFSGISTDSIVSYIGNGSDIHYNRISSVSNDGTSITVEPITTVVGVATGTIGVTDTTKLRLNIGVPFIQSYNDGSLYAELPSTFVSSVNLQNSSLTFKAQTTGNITVNSSTLTVDSSFFDLPIGLSTSAFQGFDQERYSIHWTDGTIETLSSDQVVLSGDLNQITFNFNTVKNKTTDSIIATLVKTGIKSKTKIYNKSQILNIEYSKYQKSGTNDESSISDGLEYKNVYGVRVQDEQISLNYPDVVKIVGVFESLTDDYAELDSLTFNSIANIFQNSIIGEKIVGRTSGAVAQVIRKPAGNPNKLDIVLLNTTNFSESETVDFEESGLSTTVVSVSVGKYKNITNAFLLDGAQKGQYYDYSRLIRKSGQPEPKRKLTIIFNHYTVPSNDSGDVFTVLSYAKEQYRTLLPRIGTKEISASDILDFRPRVSPITDVSSLSVSPFDFASRNFGVSPNIEPNVVLAPNETLSLSFDYYVGRVDRFYLDRTGKFTLKQGVPGIDPKAPENLSNSMLLATLYYPPYLENAGSTVISLESNKRYTMKDIGGLETRLDSLEKLTTLSLLELNTKTLEIRDSDGLDRFKTGFFVDNFSSSQFVDLSLSNVLIDTENKNIIPFRVENTLPNVPVIRNSNVVDNLSKREIYKSNDGNIRFSGDFGDPNSLTLDYVSVGWIEQPFATLVENVNPFHVTEYIGNLSLNPSEDRWVRTIQLPDKTFISTSVVRLEPRRTSFETIIEGSNTTQLVRASDFDAQFGGKFPNGTTRSITSLSSGTSRVVSDQVVQVGPPIDRVAYQNVPRVLSVYNETYIRSRNVEFYSVNLKPFTRFYQFFDGNSQVDYISKIIEVTPTQGTFQIGEDVIGYDSNSNKKVITFKLAAPNHKEGDNLNKPTAIYEGCPYDRSILPSNYSSSSKYLNIDTKSLAKEAQGEYSGSLSSTNIRFVGKTSGAVATLSQNLLISDAYGDLIGTFYLQDPNTNPAPAVRFEVGTKTYKLTSSNSNQVPLPGSTDISYAETNYSASGTVNETRNETLINRTVTTQRQIITEVTRTRTTTTLQRYDPLAQSFEVGRTSQSPTNSNVDPVADRQGAFLTAVDIYFAKVDSGNAPVTIQVRSMQLGTPTLTQLGESVTLRPNDILPNGRRLKDNVSQDASRATTVVFPYPIYLPPDDEYAIVLLAPESVGYEVFIAEMNQNTLNASSLTGIAAEEDRKKYSKQFAIGSLFKSQNGSIWTANQYQDLKFKLYKAQFVSNGTAFFNNPILNENTIDSYFGNLIDNPIEIYPRKLSVGFTTTPSTSPVFSSLTEGRKITESGTKTGYIFGFVEDIGGPVAGTPIITNDGENYETGNNLETFNITGNGYGLSVNITGVNDGNITSLSVSKTGRGYKVGDVVGIVTSSTSSFTGFGARLTINSVTSYDTLYLTNVQSNQFTINRELRYYDGGIQDTDLIINSSTLLDTVYSGNIAKVNQFNHGMYSTANKVTISGLESDFAPQRLTSEFPINGNQINVDNVGIFTSFEGVPVSSNNPGYVKIFDEIIQYVSVNTNSNILTGITRSIDSTVKSPYLINDLVYKYEMGGVSLRRLNANLEVSDISGSIDSYYIEFDRGNTALGITTRSDDTTIDGNPVPLLSFKTEDSVGGGSCKVTQNLVYSEVTPLFELYSPGAAVSANSFIRTVSGTSAGGNETPFLDLGFAPVQLNAVNKLNTLRMVCSRVNETNYLTEIADSKSYTIGITMSSSDPNLSPQIFLDNSTTNFTSYRLDRTVNDYISDGRVNEIYDSSHAATYVSNLITLEKPSTSLKVILSAYKHSSADFRVLYSLVLADSYEVQPSFTLFPGYNNLTVDNDQDGFLDIVDQSLNSGLPDRNVRPSDDNQFFEYEFTAPNLPEFVGYVIKIVMSGTDQSRPPVITDLRAISLA
jgi:hypothetical protein